jgi:hypothetical protein
VVYDVEYDVIIRLDLVVCVKLTFLFQRSMKLRSLLSSTNKIGKVRFLCSISCSMVIFSLTQPIFATSPDSPIISTSFRKTDKKREKIFYNFCLLIGRLILPILILSGCKPISILFTLE